MWLDTAAVCAPLHHTPLDVLVVYCHSVLTAVFCGGIDVFRAALSQVARGGVRRGLACGFFFCSGDVLLTARRDSWPWFFSSLLRVECAESLQKIHMPALFKKSYTLASTSQASVSYTVNSRVRLRGGGNINTVMQNTINNTNTI